MKHFKNNKVDSQMMHVGFYIMRATTICIYILYTLTNTQYVYNQMNKHVY